ncbi:DUF6415 family natural product biosynthesis protein [Streptomyces longwoodensis]|uniref:DUF6415 family natural product biosynthesis protein n=1 Tax=Streptomyces longwoodensis TaxID=68231 RepID=UPI00324BEDCD
MTTTEQHSTDAADLIAEAFDAGEQMPSHERLVELDEQLRALIERLIVVVQHRINRSPHHTPGWYAMVNAVERAEDALRFQLGTAPLACTLHVAELARKVQELRQAGGTAS